MDERAQPDGSRRTLGVGGRALALTEYPGDGPPLVLLHGIGSRGISWRPVIPGLTRWFHLYVLDLRGHGASDKPEAGYDVEDFTADLEGALNALAVERPRIMGHSLGALVTLAWGARFPDRAAAMVLEDPPLRVLPALVDMFGEWMRLAASSPAEVAEIYRERFPGWTDEERAWRAESITGTAPGVFREGRDRLVELLAARGEHLRAVSDRLPPTLLVYGEVEAGGMVTPADAEYFTRSVPGSAATRVAGAGHSIHRDRPEEFLQLVVPFLLRESSVE